MDLLLSWKATREDLGELKLLTDNSAAVAHFIMVHYEEKEGIKKKKKKKYKPKAGPGQYQMEAGIKRFGERGE